MVDAGPAVNGISGERQLEANLRTATDNDFTSLTTTGSTGSLTIRRRTFTNLAIGSVEYNGAGDPYGLASGARQVSDLP